jgi:hypothetical protein
MTRPFHPSRLGYSNYTWRRVQVRKSGSAGIWTRDLWVCSQELWPLDNRGRCYSKSCTNCKLRQASLAIELHNCSCNTAIPNTNRICWISGSHNGVVWIFDTLLSGINPLVFRRDASLPSSRSRNKQPLCSLWPFHDCFTLRPWRWRRYIPARCLTSAALQGVTTQKFASYYIFLSHAPCIETIVKSTHVTILHIYTTGKHAASSCMPLKQNTAW